MEWNGMECRVHRSPFRGAARPPPARPRDAASEEGHAAANAAGGGNDVAIDILYALEEGNSHNHVRGQPLEALHDGGGGDRDGDDDNDDNDDDDDDDAGDDEDDANAEEVAEEMAAAEATALLRLFHEHFRFLDGNPARIRKVIQCNDMY